MLFRKKFYCIETKFLLHWNFSFNAIKKPETICMHLNRRGCASKCILFLFNKLPAKASIDFFIRFVTTHLTDGILQHYILLEKMVDRHFILCLVVHRAFEEEAQETLNAIASGTCGKVA